MPPKRLLNTPLDQPLTTEILVNGRIVPAAPGELLIEAMNRAAALANDTLREAGQKVQDRPMSPGERRAAQFESS